jgi:hypothetical protein
MKNSLHLLAVAALVAGMACARTPLVSAADADQAKPSETSGKGKTGVASLIGWPLRLNGSQGELRFAKGENGAALRIDKLTLAGEVISDPQQKCQITIVADTPIAATPVSAAAGELSYLADIPACPLNFTALDGAAYAPPQQSACVFKAADCQASPSGLWGPDAETLASKAKQIAHDRAAAEKAIEASVRKMEKADKSATQRLVTQRADFAATLENTCRDYAGEAQHDFCHARLTQWRAHELRELAAKAKKTEDDSNE